MKIEKDDIGEEYNTSAIEESDPTISTISIPRIREPRDIVYNGTVDALPNEETVTGRKISSHGKGTHKRKISPFYVVLILFFTAVITVLYIGNILVVGRLLNQINNLQIKHQQIVNQQELLKAQINKLSNLERIQQLAHDQLGLEKTKQLPVWIEIDPEKINQVEEVINETESGQ